jgi:hypothetical protein
MNTNDKLKKYYELIDHIEKNHHLYTDEELNDKLTEAIPFDYEIHNPRIDKIIKKRVEKYCENNNITIYEYNGCLPYKCFKIPVGGLSREEAEKQIYQLMSEYHKDVKWDDNLGSVTINGDSKIPFTKSMWFPKK